MLSALRRTISRSGHFLGSALAWRSPEGQYLPIVLAMIAGWIGLLASLRGDPSGFELACAAVYLSSVLVAVCAVDARYGIIPDSMVAALAVGGLVQTILASQTAPFPDLLQRIAEASIFLAVACAFRSLYRLIRGHHGLGFGDVKFATAGMLWVGIESAPLLLVVAVISAVSSLLVLAIRGHQLSGQNRIAFGPHLAIGLWLSWIVNVAPLDVYWPFAS